MQKVIRVETSMCACGLARWGFSRSHHIAPLNIHNKAFRTETLPHLTSSDIQHHMGVGRQKCPLHPHPPTTTLIRYIRRWASSENSQSQNAHPWLSCREPPTLVCHSQAWPVKSDKAVASKSRNKSWTSPKSKEQHRLPPLTQPWAQAATKHRSQSRVMI